MANPENRNRENVKGGEPGRSGEKFAPGRSDRPEQDKPDKRYGHDPNTGEGTTPRSGRDTSGGGLKKPSADELDDQNAE